MGVCAGRGVGPGESCDLLREGDNGPLLASRATSLSRAAWLIAGLNVTLPGLPRRPGDPDLLNKSEGSTLLSRISFFTLCRPPLPRPGLELLPRKPSGPPGAFPSALLSDSALGFPEENDMLDDNCSDAKPRSFVLAGVYPNCSRGTGERVGTSTKKPGFFFGC